MRKRRIISIILILILVIMMITPAFAAKKVNLEPEVITIDEGTSTTFTLKVSDKSGGEYTWDKNSLLENTITETNHNVKKTSVETTFNYVGDNDGDDTLTITYESTTTKKILILKITVNDVVVNNPPTISGYSGTITDEDSPLVVTINAFDKDEDTMTYTASSVLNGSLNVPSNESGVFTFTPTVEGPSTGVFDVTVTDGNGGSANETVTIEIEGLNDVPIIIGNYDFSVVENSIEIFGINAEDDDGDTLSYSVTGGDGVSISGNTVTYDPVIAGPASDYFTITVDDGNASVDKVVQVTITEVNDIPVFIGEPYLLIVNEDEEGSITVVATDSDALTYSLESGVSNGDVAVSGDVFTYTPIQDFNGNDSFTIRAEDSDSAFAITTVNITVDPINDAPVISGTYSGITSVDAPINFTIISSDVDDDNADLTYSFSNVTSGLVSISINVFTYTPSAVGAHAFDVTVSDGFDESTITVTVTVNEIIEGPYSYLALGDSIPYGVSYEESISVKRIESYTDKLFNELDTPDNPVIYNNLTESSINIVDVYNQVINPDNYDAISSADLITLCIGANDIMDAAPETSSGRDFYNVNWTIADAGLNDIEYYWDDIIKEIYRLNSDVELIVMNMYNPYKTSDLEPNVQTHILYPTLTMHDLVDKYFYSEEDLDGDNIIDYGLNYIIENPKEVYPDFSHTYKVVNVYSDFETYQDNKGDYVAFYDNVGYLWFFPVDVQDPHPTALGQERIYELHNTVFNQ